MTTTQNTAATKCLSCQYAEQDEMTTQERNHWMLWGCTCDAETEAEAVAYMEGVTQ